MQGGGLTIGFLLQQLRDLLRRIVRGNGSFALVRQNSRLQNSWPSLSVRVSKGVRHTAKNAELLTVEQRVNKAMMKVKSDRAFTPEQEKCLDLIRRHLIQNLLMEKEDVESLPIFTREGASWGKLNKVFKGELATIIHVINQAVVA